MKSTPNVISYATNKTQSPTLCTMEEWQQTF